VGVSHVVLDSKYDEITKINLGQKSFLIKTKRDSSFSLFNLSGKHIGDTTYKEIELFGRVVYAKNINKKWGTLYSENDNKLDFIYYEISKLFSKYSHDNFVKIKKNDTYGLLDNFGNIVLDFECEDIEAYNRFSLKQKVFFAKKNDKWGVIKFVKDQSKLNTKNNYLKENLLDFKYYKYTQIYTSSKNMFALIRLNDKISLLDENVNFISDQEYQDIKSFFKYHFENGIYAAKKNDKWGLININPRTYDITETTNFKYDEIKTLSNKSGLFRVNVGNKWGIMNENGKMEIKPQFDYINQKLNRIIGYKDSICQEITIYGEIKPVPVYISRKHNLGFGLSRINNGCFIGIVDSLGNMILDYKYLEIHSFSPQGKYYPYDMAKVNYRGKFGYILKDGTFIVEPKYDVLKAYQEGMARVKINGKWGFIDVSGKKVIDIKYDYLEPFTNGKSKVILGDETFYIDTLGKRID
jgi:hypothetical protein